MPVALQGRMRPEAWDRFTDEVNASLRGTSAKFTRISRCRLTLIGLSTLTVLGCMANLAVHVNGGGLRVVDTGDSSGHLSFSLFFAVAAPFLAITVGQYLLSRFINNAALDGSVALSQACSNATAANPGLTFVVKEEHRPWRRSVARPQILYHIEASWPTAKPGILVEATPEPPVEDDDEVVVEIPVLETGKPFGRIGASTRILAV
eukprot:CAMPEP_0176121610 /NCGR_PEP_ID=MMETSP0120_2-20121206/61222_1 /TAXON_ID=160619 /ORGANISM="Kryptoperidinium foliaceum, Strain CCMP 1326" /LENGTH=205 /DNA_ID=CAMNT_0017456177 /DNA_START=38 /DNA_END=655 /DNA_ORIENTATION=+